MAAWPAQIDDVKSAIEFLVSHAAEYGIHPERMGILGVSAGGHLSLMAGVLPAEQDDTHRLRYIVNYFGPVDLVNVKNPEQVRGFLEPLIGGRLEDRARQLKVISPVTHIDRTDPPVLTFHGTADPPVRFNQAEILHTALKNAQIPEKLFPMKDVGHAISGDAEIRNAALKDFLTAYLSGGSLPLPAHEDFDEDASRWQPTDRGAWKVIPDGGRSVYSLVKKRSDDKPRISIAKERTAGTDWSRGWHRARIKRDTRTGTIEVYFDGMRTPIMKATDHTFATGRNRDRQLRWHR
ncbi:MAG: prolyl oligopeptidase family serine peptidase [Planctomycetaceae bacterium]